MPEFTSAPALPNQRVYAVARVLHSPPQTRHPTGAPSHEVRRHRRIASFAPRPARLLKSPVRPIAPLRRPREKPQKTAKNRYRLSYTNLFGYNRPHATADGDQMNTRNTPRPQGQFQARRTDWRATPRCAPNSPQFASAASRLRSVCRAICASENQKIANSTTLNPLDQANFSQLGFLRLK